MLTLLTTIFGGGSAILTNVLKIFTEASKDKRDKAHELALYNLQVNSVKDSAAALVVQAKANASAVESQAIADSIDVSIKSKFPIIAILNGIIRPLTTIAYVVAFFFFLHVVYVYAVSVNYTPIQIMSLAIFELFFSTLNFILSFWFVNRQLGK